MRSPLRLEMALLILVGGLSAPTSGQVLDCGAPTYPIDVRARTVAGVRLDMRVDSLANSLGTDRISKSSESLEGSPSPLYVLDICGHRLERHWNGLSWRDPAFEMTDGVGVGKPLAAFDTVYGAGTAMWTEAGIAIAYRYDQLELFATVDEACTTQSDVGEPTVQSRNCAVREVWIPLQTLPG